MRGSPVKKEVVTAVLSGPKLLLGLEPLRPKPLAIRPSLQKTLNGGDTLMKGSLCLSDIPKPSSSLITKKTIDLIKALYTCLSPNSITPQELSPYLANLPKMNLIRLHTVWDPKRG